MERRSTHDELRFSDDDLLSFGSSVRPESPFKLLAVDLDGTVLSRDGVPHEVDRAAIARLRDAGVPTTIVTGRLYSGSREIARTLGIEGPIACVDGSQIVDTRSDEEVFARAIAADTASIVRDLLSEHGAASFLFAQDLIVHDAAGAPFASASKAVARVRAWDAGASL